MHQTLFFPECLATRQNIACWLANILLHEYCILPKIIWCMFIIQGGMTAMAVAASRGHKQVVDLLLKAGAKIDIQNKVTECVHADYDVYCNVHVSMP